MANLPNSDEIIKHLNGRGFQVKDWYDHPQGGAYCILKHSWLPPVRFGLNTAAVMGVPQATAQRITQDYILFFRRKLDGLEQRYSDDNVSILCVEKE